MAGNEDLPRVLMLEDGERCNSVLSVGVPRILGVCKENENATGVIQELVGDGDKGNERVWLEGEKRRSDLDYFDFGSATGSGAGIEEINDDVLERK